MPNESRQGLTRDFKRLVGVLPEEVYHQAPGADRNCFTYQFRNYFPDGSIGILKVGARILERMAKIDMSLEIELGVTGGEEDGIGSEFEEGADNSKLYTQPEDVLRAYKLLNPIGHFSVAASFGNVHGVYKPGNVRLRPDILKNSQVLVQQSCGTGENPLHQVDPEDGTPYKKQYDPRAYLRLAEEGIVARLQEACDDLGSKGRSIASA